MPSKKRNRVKLFVNLDHALYIYGAIGVVGGGGKTRPSGAPFVISKVRLDRCHVFYGSVARNVTKVWSQRHRLLEFRKSAEPRLAAAGIQRVPGTGSQLPESELSDEILEEQEEFIEEILLSLSLEVRLLSEICHGQDESADDLGPKLRGQVRRQDPTHASRKSATTPEVHPDLERVRSGPHV